MSSLKVLSLSRRPCIGKLNSLLPLGGANFLDHYPTQKIRSVQGLGLPSPPCSTRSITYGGWSCTSFKDPHQGAKSGTDPASGSGTKSGAESCGSPTPGEAAGHGNERKRRCRRTRQRDEAFRAKLGFALLRQGGVNLWKKARKEAKNFEFEETKRIVQTRVEQSKVKVKELRENIFTIPNLLTTTRLALAPYLGYLVINEQYLLGSSLFALAGVTDLLDGWIARNFKNQQSVLGSIIDPLADKCLISILTITLTYSDLIPVPLTALIIVRDVGLMSAAFYLRYQSLPPPVTLRRYFDVTHATVQMKPTFISKVNTAVQLCLVGFTILAPVLNYTDHPYLHGLWYVTAATTVLSGLSYCFKRDVFKYLTKGR